MPQAAVQQGGCLGGIDDFLYKGALIKKALSVRVAFVKPMCHEPGAHVCVFPQSPAILETVNIVEIGIRPPNPGVVSLFKLSHRSHYTMPRRFAQAA